MTACGIVLLGEDDYIAAKAKNTGLGVTMGEYGVPPYDKTLFVKPGVTVPWDLLTAAWHFLDRWDAAVPLWRYGTNACDVGSKEERKRTQAVVRDLRVLLYSYELLFVRDNDAGQALMAAFVEELEESSEPRFAFLRAFYRVKPRLCVLPRSWLAEIHEQSKRAQWKRSRAHQFAGRQLVEVEIAPGRYIKCHKGDEEKVREQFARRLGGRRGRR